MLEVLLFVSLLTLSTAVVQSGFGGHGGGSPFYMFYNQGWPFVAFHRDTTLAADSAGGISGFLHRFSGIHTIDALPLLYNALVIFAISMMLLFIGRKMYAFVRKPQFSIRTLLIVLLLASLACSLWASCVYRRAQERQVASYLTEMGWTVGKDAGAIIPQWLYVLMDNLHVPAPDCACRVTTIVWRMPPDKKPGIESTDRWKDVNAMLHDIEPQLKSLKHCNNVRVWDSGLTDEGIAAICRSLRGCDAVDFATSSRITDDSVENIAKAWPGLKYLRLENMSLSEKGMMHVLSLVDLEHLHLIGKCDAIAPSTRIAVAKLPLLKVLEYPSDWEHTKGLLEILEEREIMHGSYIDERFNEDLTSSEQEEEPFW